MSEFFKQVITQLSSIWQKLSVQQKLVTGLLCGFTVLGLIGLMLWAKETPTDGGYKTLYTDLDLDDAAVITAKLTEAKTPYKIENNGRTIMVDQKRLYETRMTLARDGLPKAHGFGYELFDKTNLGTTDFVQKLNARRALEGELQRSIEGLSEVKSARVHLVLPEPTIFLEQQKEPKASVVVKMLPGRQLDAGQIRGVTYLVSSSVDGLKPENISLVDFGGKLLSSPFGGDPTALASSQNIELQHNVEIYMEHKIAAMLEGVLGPNKTQVKCALEMDFDRVEKTMEQYNPESRVIRSEERTDENVKNAPNGDRTQEKSLTNNEIDKTISHLVGANGAIKRLTLSGAVDGRYEAADKKGNRKYIARTPDELQK
ncbi:MAG: flagellar basal-body MS-ring/collar protein FliF, partial [Chitinivibrionales bacterium]|nr:flagellar basal-body MS-ring/collar protein FliF [Chitinivibrionales bacterium]